MAVSEAAANCAAKQLEGSPLGNFFMNEENLNEFLYLTPGTLKMTTSSIASNIKIFEEIFGPNVPIEIDLSYRDMKFSFAPDTDIDLHVEYILQMRVIDRWGNNGGGQFYDEIPMQLGGKVELHDNIIHGEIKYLNMNIHEKYGQKTQPHSNQLEMTENDYRSFLSDFSLSLNFIKKHYNDVILRTGIPFPYDVPEFYTSVAFYPQAAYFLFETESEFKQSAFRTSLEEDRYRHDNDEESMNPYADDYDGYSMSPGYDRS